MDDFDLLTALQPDWRDALEILLVAVVFHRVLRMIQGTPSLRILAGVLVTGTAYTVAWLLDLRLLVFLLNALLAYGALALLVVFQPELRAALTPRVQAPLARVPRRMDDGPLEDEIADAVERLARSGIGAIIAIEHDASLAEYVDSGSAMHARLGADLLATIFTPYSPLHDGAVIVRGDSIIGAGCILPLSQAVVTDRSIGTRHRAALGLSEETDATVIVVSEETSRVSVARGGVLRQQLSIVQLRDLLGGRIPTTTAEHGIGGA